MTDSWTENYRNAEDLNEKYSLLRDEMAMLRNEAGSRDRFDRKEVAQTIRELDDQITGNLVVFTANDFGLPVAFRPKNLDRAVQNKIRQSLLEKKYSQHEDLNEIRQKLLAEHPSIHKAIVAESSGDRVRYHLPEGSKTNTNFLTVREMVGLVDWTTNSCQKEGLTETF